MRPNANRIVKGNERKALEISSGERGDGKFSKMQKERDLRFKMNPGRVCLENLLCVTFLDRNHQIYL